MPKDEAWGEESSEEPDSGLAEERLCLGVVGLELVDEARNVGPHLSPPLYFFIWLHRVLVAARGLFHLRCGMQDYFWLWHENP